MTDCCCEKLNGHIIRKCAAHAKTRKTIFQKYNELLHGFYPTTIFISDLVRIRNRINLDLEVRSQDLMKEAAEHG